MNRTVQHKKQAAKINRMEWWSLKRHFDIDQFNIRITQQFNNNNNNKE